MDPKPHLFRIFYRFKLVLRVRVMFIGWSSVYLLIPGVLKFPGPGSECIIYDV